MLVVRRNLKHENTKNRKIDCNKALIQGCNKSLAKTYWIQKLIQKELKYTEKLK